MIMFWHLWYFHHRLWTFSWCRTFHTWLSLSIQPWSCSSASGGHSFCLSFCWWRASRPTPLTMLQRWGWSRLFVFCFTSRTFIYWRIQLLLLLVMGVACSIRYTYNTGNTISLLDTHPGNSPSFMVALSPYGKYSLHHTHRKREYLQVWSMPSSKVSSRSLRLISRSHEWSYYLEEESIIYSSIFILDRISIRF